MYFARLAMSLLSVLQIWGSDFFLVHLRKVSAPALGLVLAGFLSVSSHAQEKSPLEAFEGFVKKGDLKSAHFYLENKLIESGKIETSRLFVESIFLSNEEVDRRAPYSIRHLPSVELLYNYLNAIQPIELNGLHKCTKIGGILQSSRVCNLASFLFAEKAEPKAFEFFLRRGMNLSMFSSDTLPPVAVLVSKLGVVYGLSELNWFSENGAPLGSELYTRQQLAAWGGFVSHGYFDHFPGNKPDSSQYNFLDLLTLSIANSDYRGQDLNLHRDFLCRYISHISRQMAPTFDHFSFLLTNVGEFRAAKIGQESYPSQWNAQTRAVFPHSCRVLIEAMGRSSLRLDQMINRFSAAADLKTAQWLVSLKQSKGVPNVENN